jgi:hypothetical protein
MQIEENGQAQKEQRAAKENDLKKHTKLPKLFHDGKFP